MSKKNKSVILALAPCMEVLGRKSKAMLCDCVLVMILYCCQIFGSFSEISRDHFGQEEPKKLASVCESV